MRARRTPPFVEVGLALLLLLAVTACASPPRPYEPRLVHVPSDEAYEHPHSNVQFTPRARALLRSDIVEHDEQGFGGSAYYRSPMFGATAEANFYPGTRDEQLDESEVREHLAVLESAIVHSLPGARIVDEQEDTWVVNGSELRGYHAAWALSQLEDVDEEMESHLYLFPTGSWYLEFRIMYPADMSEDVAPQIARFLDAQWWNEGE